MITNKEIAEKAGVSTATVSRVLDPRFSNKVNAEMRKRVIAVCDRENYYSNASGRSCATGKTFKVGVILGDPVHDLGNMIFAYCLKEICFELQLAGYTTLFLCAGNSSELQQNIINFLRSKIADAYIIGGSLIDKSVWDVINKTKCKVVSLRQCKFLEHSMSITRDYIPAFEDIWNRIPRTWKDKVVFLGPDNGNTHEKYVAALKCAPAKMSLPNIIINISASNMLHQRYEGCCAIREIRDQLRQYKLIWCSSDLVAIAVFDTMSEIGLVAGKDYYLVGFDNLDAIEPVNGTPFLSSVDSCQEEFGRAAAKLVLECLNKNTPVKTCNISIPLKYVPRMSFPFLSLKNKKKKGCFHETENHAQK